MNKFGYTELTVIASIISVSGRFIWERRLIMKEEMGTNGEQVPREDGVQWESAAIEDLEALKLRLQNDIKDMRGMKPDFQIIALVICLVSLTAYIIFNNVWAFIGLPIGLLILGIDLQSTREITRELEIQIQGIDNELELLKTPETSLEKRAEKLFKLHQFELKKYYDRAIRRSTWIFVVGIACIVLGFAIIGITAYIVVSSPTKELSEKIILASLGAVGGILSNFIAVTYLKMYSETKKSLAEFHNSVVLAHRALWQLSRSKK